MATLHDVLKSLFSAAGIDAENLQEAKTLLENEELKKVDFPDNVRGVVLNNLMTVEAAKNNQKLSDHFRHVHLSGIDSKLKTILDDLDFPDDVKAEILAAEKTNQKIDVLKNKLRDLYEKKGTGAKSKQEFEEERKKLNDEINALKSSIPTIRQEEQSKYTDMLKNRDLNVLFSTFEYGLDLPKDVLTSTALGLVNKDLADKKYKLGYDPSTSNFRLLTDSDMEVFVDNKPVNYKDYVTKILADSKMLKATDSGRKDQSTSTQQQHIQSGKDQQKFADADQYYKDQIAELQKFN